jgi:AraC-like DNA-binding protein
MMPENLKKPATETSHHSVWRHACLRVCAACEQLGINSETLLNTAGLALADLKTSGFRAPLAAHQRLVSAAVLATGREDLGLYINQEQPALGNTLIQNAISASDSGVKAFSRMKKLAMIVDSSLILNYEIRGDNNACILSVSEDWPDPIANYHEDLMMSALVKVGGVVLGSAESHLWVEFRRDEPQDATAWHEFFGDNIIWGADQSKAWFKRATLTKNNPAANETVALANFQSATLWLLNDSPLINAVKISISQRMADRNAIQKAVASDVGLEVRTLQRKLKAEGTSFGSLLAETRRTEAVAQLSAGKSVGVMSAELGFADQSAFSSAFKGWFGMSPMKYKKQIKSNSQAR